MSEPGEPQTAWRNAETRADGHGGATPGRSGQGLHIRCPHCQAGIEVVVDAALTDIACPTCGSHFSLIGGAEDTRTAPALKTVGRFELLERLGIGGFGTVWKARDAQLDRSVAVKIPRKGQLDSDEAEKFIREARAAAQLKHPHIVSVYEVGRDGDTIYIVSDFVRGVSLADRLTGEAFSPRDAARLCRTIALALVHAHAHGVVHRDLKPANILLDDQGEPHLTDFGLAKREAGEVTMTVDGQILGTPAYMPPEQALGEAHRTDGRSDVYSLGVILFELLAGRLPFRGNARLLLHQVINDPPPRPRKLKADVPRDLETIVLLCLEKDAVRRYATAQALADDLGRYLAGEPIHARPIGPARRAWRWCRRNPALAVASAVAVALLAAHFVRSLATPATVAANVESDDTLIAEVDAEMRAIAAAIGQDDAAAVSATLAALIGNERLGPVVIRHRRAALLDLQMQIALQTKGWDLAGPRVASAAALGGTGRSPTDAASPIESEAPGLPEPAPPSSPPLTAASPPLEIEPPPPTDTARSKVKATPPDKPKVVAAKPRLPLPPEPALVPETVAGVVGRALSLLQRSEVDVEQTLARLVDAAKAARKLIRTEDDRAAVEGLEAILPYYASITEEDLSDRVAQLKTAEQLLAPVLAKDARLRPDPTVVLVSGGVYLQLASHAAEATAKRMYLDRAYATAARLVSDYPQRPFAYQAHLLAGNAQEDRLVLLGEPTERQALMAFERAYEESRTANDAHGIAQSLVSRGRLRIRGVMRAAPPGAVGGSKVGAAEQRSELMKATVDLRDAIGQAGSSVELSAASYHWLGIAYSHPVLSNDFEAQKSFTAAAELARPRSWAWPNYELARINAMVESAARQATAQKVDATSIRAAVTSAEAMFRNHDDERIAERHRTRAIELAVQGWLWLGDVAGARRLYDVAVQQVEPRERFRLHVGVAEQVLKFGESSGAKRSLSTGEVDLAQTAITAAMDSRGGLMPAEESLLAQVNLSFYRYWQPRLTAAFEAFKAERKGPATLVETLHYVRFHMKTAVRLGNTDTQLRTALRTYTQFLLDHETDWSKPRRDKAEYESDVKTQAESQAVEKRSQ